MKKFSGGIHINLVDYGKLCYLYYNRYAIFGGELMKIILDDRRYVLSNSPYNVVRNYEDCVEMIRLFRKISFISLDYDLGVGKTGYDVLVYMKENEIEVKHINIHSDHSIGVPKMQEYAWKHFPNTSLTFNPLNFEKPS